MNHKFNKYQTIPQSTAHKQQSSVLTIRIKNLFVTVMQPDVVHKAP